MSTNTAFVLDLPAAEKTDDLTVNRKWKVEEELAERLSQRSGRSKLIPVAKWVATVLFAGAVLCLFVASKLSFLSLSVLLRAARPDGAITPDNKQQWVRYTGQFLVVYLVLTIPYLLQLLRAVWTGLLTRQEPWPKRSAVLYCVLIGVMEPLGLVLLALKVLPSYSPSVGALAMGSVVTVPVLVAVYKSLSSQDGGLVKGFMVASALGALGGLILTVLLMAERGLSTDIWHVAVAVSSLSVAWLPWLHRQTTLSNQIASTDQGPTPNVTASASPMGPTPSTSNTSSMGSYGSNDQRGHYHPNTVVPIHGRLSKAPKSCYAKATWKASFIMYLVKTLSTFVMAFFFFYVDSDFSMDFSEDMHQAFLDAWTLASSVDSDGYTWSAFTINLVCSLLCYSLVYMVCYTNMQRGGLAVPVLLSLPLTVCTTRVGAMCRGLVGLDQFCQAEDGKLPYLLLATALLTLAHTLAFGRRALSKANIYLQKEKELFWSPGYNGVIIDSWLLLNRRLSVKEGQRNMRVNLANKTRVYICTTMYREDEKEMTQILESLGKVNVAQANGQTFFESHIIFDGGVVQKKLSEFALVLVSLLEETLGIKPETCTKIHTPYGTRLSWGLPTTRGKAPMTFNIHLKDNTLVKNKKRWSQVMYMSYVLDFLLDTAGPEEETYILTTDADVMFSPDSVEALLDRMSRDNTIGAVCARTHPMGSGPLVWYQIFEYAVGHWFQKAAEHVLGSVMCAPGCFSVYRCRALADILPKYCKKVDSAFDFLTKDMGEDRWLCTLMVQSGWQIEYCAASENSTNCPSEFEEFYKQRRRWIASTLANLMLVIKEWRYIALFNRRISVVFLVYQSLLLFSTLISPSMVVLIVAGGLAYAWQVDSITAVILQIVVCMLFSGVCIITAPKTQMKVAKAYTFVYAAVMCAVAVGTAEQIVSDLNPKTEIPKNNESSTTPSSPSQHISLELSVSVTTIYLGFLVGVFLLGGLLHPREMLCLVHGLWYLLCIPSGYLVLIIYSVCNLTDSSWGTREGASESNVMKKEPWFVTFRTLFYKVFFCCAAPNAVKYGVDQAAQTSWHISRRTSSISEEAKNLDLSRISPDDFDKMAAVDTDNESLATDFAAYELDQEIEVEDVPIPVEDWLPPEFKMKYTDVFRRHGFDNTLFIKALTEPELNRMGITVRGHVQHLLAQISLIPAFDIESQVPTNVKEWLHEIGLPMYKDNFWRSHIRKPKEMEILKRFDKKDIIKDLGITKEGHIKRLLYAIRMLRDPTETERRAMKMRQAIEETPINYLKEFNVAEYEFWNQLRDKCLEPDLKAFGIEAEVKEKLVELRNNWLMVMAVSNTLWLILITTLAAKVDLTVLGANPLGLCFLFVFGFLFLVQFLCMLVHRLSTLAHHLARAPYQFGKGPNTYWSFGDKAEQLEDTEDIRAVRQVKLDAERALKRTLVRDGRSHNTTGNGVSPRVTERTSLLGVEAVH